MLILIDAAIARQLFLSLNQKWWRDFFLA